MRERRERVGEMNGIWNIQKELLLEHMLRDACCIISLPKFLPFLKVLRAALDLQSRNELDDSGQLQLFTTLCAPMLYPIPSNPGSGQLSLLAS